MTTPFIVPMRSPMARPVRSATYHGIPVSVLATSAQYMPAAPTAEPTDRSIPPVRTTKVIPSASRPLMDAWRSILSIFVTVRNLAFITVKNIMMTTRPRMTPYFARNSLMLNCLLLLFSIIFSSSLICAIPPSA